MRVGELIKVLSEVDPKTTVYVQAWSRKGYRCRTAEAVSLHVDFDQCQSSRACITGPKPTIEDDG